MRKNISNCQRGLATLTIAVVVLITVTIMVIFATRVGIFDQRMAANEIRYKEAFAQAEAGLDFATQHFNNAFRRDAQPLTNISSIITQASVTTRTKPDGTAAGTDEGGFTVTITATGASFGSTPIFEFTAIGIGADGTGTATISRQITMAHVLGGGKAPDVPIAVSGAVGTGGNFNVVANPNAGGPGIPVSVWSNATISVSSSSATCHMQYYDGNNAQCSNPSGNAENISRGTNPAVALTTHDPTKPDLLPNDPNFPDDLFRFVFGMDRSNWSTKKSEADAYGQVVDSCASIATKGVHAGETFPLWWVTGNCSFTGGPEIGSNTKPVILVIDDGELRFTGGGKIHGIVFLFDNPSTGGHPSAQLGGGPEILGSFISDVGGTAMQGSFSVVYTPTLQDSLSGDKGGGINFTMAYIPGSWRDFN